MDTDGPRLLVVGAGPFQLDIIDCARRMGLYVCALDGRADAPGLARAHHGEVVDIVNARAVVDAARRLAVDAVVSAASDAALVGVSAVVDALGLPGPSAETVARCHDKRVTARIVGDAGLAVPITLPVDRASPSDVGGFPLVIKPASAAGGRGVTIVRRAEEVASAMTSAARYGPKVLLQAYVGGLSLGAEAVFRGGALVASFLLGDQYARPFVSPIGHSLPPVIEPPIADAVRSALPAYADALGLTDGVVNFDLRVVDGAPVLIEVNPRLGGSAITELVRAAYGADLSAAAIACALGRSPLDQLTRTRHAPVASRLLISRGIGPARVYGDPIAAWRAHPDVLDVHLDARPGRPAALTVDDWSLLGRCLVRGRDVDDAIARAAAIADDVAAAVRTDPAEPKPEDLP